MLEKWEKNLKRIAFFGAPCKKNSYIGEEGQGFLVSPERPLGNLERNSPLHAMELESL